MRARDTAMPVVDREGDEVNPRERLVAEMWADARVPLNACDTIALAVDRADHNLHRVSILMTALRIGLLDAADMLRASGYLPTGEPTVST